MKKVASREPSMLAQHVSPTPSCLSRCAFILKFMVKELSERRAKLISNALESSLHMLNTQIRHTNVRANKLLGVSDKVFESLSRHRDVGRGSVTDSMTATLLERKRSIAK